MKLFGTLQKKVLKFDCYKNYSILNKGILFENETLNTLKNYNFEIKKTKTSHDNGIDFYGHWIFKNSNNKFKVIGSVKNESKKIGTNYIREFNGVLSKHENESNLIGIFVSKSGYSNFAINEMKKSNIPLILCKIKDDQINFFLMNSISTKLLSPILNIGIERSEIDNKQMIFYELYNNKLIKI